MLKQHLALIALAASLGAHANEYEQNYQLDAGDTIQIEVYNEPDLSIDQLLIGASGNFDYPYLGKLLAKGKTPEQLQQEIYTGLDGEFLVAPKIRVNIITFRNIYINGEVQRPGGYEYRPGLTVDKAIALAGGFTDRASRRGITINKPNSTKAKKVSLDTEVKPGEIIVVDESFF